MIVQLLNKLLLLTILNFVNNILIFFRPKSNSCAIVLYVSCLTHHSLSLCLLNLYTLAHNLTPYHQSQPVMLKQHILTSPNSSHFQSAYCHNHSTETALLYTLDHVYHYYTANANKIQNSDFFWSQRSLQHYRPLFHLIDRLQSTIGVFGAALLWITSYLTNRSHYIKLGNISSDHMLITIGVPQ
jgi:hypothetical protein